MVNTCTFHVVLFSAPKGTFLLQVLWEEYDGKSSFAKSVAAAKNCAATGRAPFVAVWPGSQKHLFLARRERKRQLCTPCEDSGREGKLPLYAHAPNMGTPGVAPRLN